MKSIIISVLVLVVGMATLWFADSHDMENTGATIAIVGIAFTIISAVAYLTA